MCLYSIQYHNRQRTTLEFRALLTPEAAYTSFASSLTEIVAVNGETVSMHLQREHCILLWNGYKHKLN
jgi:hypothetical protein